MVPALLIIPILTTTVHLGLVVVVILRALLVVATILLVPHLRSSTPSVFQFHRNLLDLLFVQLNTKSSYGIAELFNFVRAVTIRALFEDLLLFVLGYRYHEILAKLHELSKVNFCHALLELLKLSVLGNVLFRVEIKDLLDAPPTHFIDIQYSRCDTQLLLVRGLQR